MFKVNIERAQNKFNNKNSPHITFETNSCGSLSHLFEHKNTVSWANELRQFSNASLVKVRPREATMVEVDLGAAVFPIPLDCTWTQNKKQMMEQALNTQRDIQYVTVRAPSVRPETYHLPVSDWFDICCLMLSGEDDFGGALLLKQWKISESDIEKLLKLIHLNSQSHQHLVLYSLFLRLHHGNLPLFLN